MEQNGINMKDFSLWSKNLIKQREYKLLVRPVKITLNMGPLCYAAGINLLHFKMLHIFILLNKLLIIKKERPFDHIEIGNPSYNKQKQKNSTVFTNKSLN